MTNDQDTKIQEIGHRNDIRILTPLLLMALVIAGGLLFLGVGHLPAPAG
jgi:hypothetical protein